MPAAKKRRVRAILTVVTLVALVLIVFGLRHQIFDTIGNLHKINGFALLLILVWQAINYHSYAKLYQNFFAILGERTNYKTMLRTAIELNFVNTVFPTGGVSGFSYLGIKMRAQGISPGKTTLVQMMRFIFVFISFQILLVAGLLMLAIGGQANPLMLLVAGSLATLLLILTAGMAFVIGSKKRINAFFTFMTSLLNRAIHLFRPSHPETINVIKAQELFTELHENYMILKTDLPALWRPLLRALTANATELLTIYTIYVAYGQFVNPGAVIIAYAVANFAGLLSVLPAGIGVYETLTTAVLAAGGIPAAVGLPVTITYRVINAITQLPIGYALYYRTLHPRRHHYERQQVQTQEQEQKDEPKHK